MLFAMEVTQPFVVLSAFAAGLAFMFATRLIWTIIRHSIHIAILAVAFVMLAHSGYIDTEALKHSGIAETVSKGASWVSTSASDAKAWFSRYNVQVRVVRVRDDN